MKSVMMQLCVYVLGLSSCVLHTVMYLKLFGWIIYIRIRAPD